MTSLDCNVLRHCDDVTNHVCNFVMFAFIMYQPISVNSIIIGRDVVAIRRLYFVCYLLLYVSSEWR